MGIKFFENEDGLIESDYDVESIMSGDLDLFLDSISAYSGEFDGIVFNEGLKIIGDESLRGENLGGCLQIPSSVEQLGFFCFAETGFDYVEFLGDKVKRIPVGCFRDASNLHEIVLPSKLESIESSAFSYCSDLKTIEIPKTVKSIGSGAFSYCESLKDLTLPDELESIGIEYCESFKEFYSTHPFFGCEKLEKVKTLGVEFNVTTEFVPLMWSYLCNAKEEEGFSDYLRRAIKDSQWKIKAIDCYRAEL